MSVQPIKNKTLKILIYVVDLMVIENPENF